MGFRRAWRIVIAICPAYGLWQGVQTGDPLAGLLAGAIIGGILWIITKAVESGGP